MGFLSAKKRQRRTWRKRLFKENGRPSWRGWDKLGNIGLVLVLWGVGVLLINLGGPHRFTNLAVGQRAPGTVVASVDFEAVNMAATELARRQAAEAVVPIFRIQTGDYQAAVRMINKLAEMAVSRREGKAAPAATASVEEGLELAADLMGMNINGGGLAGLFPAGREWDGANILQTVLHDIWMGGILSEEEKTDGIPGLAQVSQMDIFIPADGSTTTLHVDMADLPSVSGACAQFAAEAKAALEEADIPADTAALATMARTLLQPNLVYDIQGTQERRIHAARNQEAVMMTVRAGTTLMEERTPVTPDTLELITAYNRRMAELELPRDRMMKRLGDYALMLIVLVVCIGWLKSTQPKAYAKAQRKWLLILLALVAVGMESLYHYLSVNLNWIPAWLVPFAIPLALPIMIAVLMAGPAAGLATGLWVSLSASLIFDRSFEFLLLGLSSTVIAVALLRNVRKRSQVMRTGLAIGGVEVVMALALAVVYQQMPGTFLWQMLTGIASGIFAAILTTVILPPLEWLFRHTTDISLLELTDMSHPLLKRLALEAPGTYHHSLMVAAIGQSAADRIGADGLQVAVCAYFHDIGKLAKPEFFAENQHGGDNPHDNLSPSMSALIIQSHVKEGLALAKRHKLPMLVCNGIRTHHGTTLTSYFYQLVKQALKEADLPEDPGLEHSFRYDGPRPWTREQAVLMMADTVEAASRSLEKATPTRISEMVETLLQDKLLDGQFDQCPLTMEEFSTVRESLIFSLTNTLHGRNPYLREDQIAQSTTSVAPADTGLPPSGADSAEADVSR